MQVILIDDHMTGMCPMQQISYMHSFAHECIFLRFRGSFTLLNAILAPNILFFKYCYSWTFLETEAWRGFFFFHYDIHSNAFLKLSELVYFFWRWPSSSCRIGFTVNYPSNPHQRSQRVKKNPNVCSWVQSQVFAPSIQLKEVLQLVSFLSPLSKCQFQSISL